jgi:hypothetical protein
MKLAVFGSRLEAEETHKNMQKIIDTFCWASEISPWADESEILERAERTLHGLSESHFWVKDI